MMDWIKRHKVKLLSVGLALAVIFGITGLPKVAVHEVSQSPIVGIGQFEITIGTEAYASDTIDYTCDGTADDVQFQAALDALPETGGKITILAGEYEITTSVAREIDDVIIQGVGQATDIDFDDHISACFDIGTQDGWLIRDLKVNAGGIDYSTATNFTLHNVYLGASYYAYLTTTGITADEFDIPTGRTATLVVAASDASDESKAQADYVCSGSDDDYYISLAIAALPEGGGVIQLTEGTYDIAHDDHIDVGLSNLTIQGAGEATQLVKDVASLSDNAIFATDDAHAYENICIKDIGFDDGNYADGWLRPLKLFQISNLWVDGCFFQGGSNYKGYNLFINCTSVKFTNNYADTMFAPVHVYGLADIETVPEQDWSNINTKFCEVSGNTFVDCGYGAATMAQDVIITNNHLYNCVSTESFAIDTCTSPKVIVSNNTITTTNTTAIYCEAGRQLVITDNTIHDVNNAGSKGISVQQPTTARTNAGDILISNNSIYETVSPAIGLYGLLSGTISNNVIEDTSDDNTSGIYIQNYKGYDADDDQRWNITGNDIYGCLRGIYIQGIARSNIAENVIANCGGTGIQLEKDTVDVTDYYPNYTKIENNYIYQVGMRADKYGRGIYIVDASTTGCEIENNIIDALNAVSFTHAIDLSSSSQRVVGNTLRNVSAATSIGNIGLSSVIYNNEGYIQHGEKRTAWGYLAAGNTTAISFAWHNPEYEDILINKVEIEVTTAGGTSGSHLDVGIADDDSGTNLEAVLFDDLDANAQQVNDSWTGADGGQQDCYIICQDNASASDDWVVGQILDEAALSLDGVYYIEYTGR